MSLVPTPEQTLILAGANLHRIDPGRYADFLEAIRGYAQQVIDQMVTCPPESLQRAQGAAVQMRALAKTLTEAPSRADKVQEKIRG